MQDLFIGVDVAKDWLDIHHPLRGAHGIANNPAAARSFAGSCAKQGAWVVFEASGGYDRVLREALERSGGNYPPPCAGRISLIPSWDGPKRS